MDEILSFFKNLDIAQMLPELGSFLGDVTGMLRLVLLIGPLVVLGLGLWYYFMPPAEANHRVGFRTYWTMGSVEAWRYAQKLAGTFYMVLGGATLVIFGIISLLYGGMDAMKMANAVLICTIILLVLVLAAWVAVNVLVLKAFDKDGNRRR